MLIDLKAIQAFVLTPIPMLATLLACQAPELPPEPFCDTLVALGEGRIDVQSDNPNEMVGFVATLEALLGVAPRAVRADLEYVRDKFAAARDAGGWRTLIDFADMQKPELAAALEANHHVAPWLTPRLQRSDICKFPAILDRELVKAELLQALYEGVSI